MRSASLWDVQLRVRIFRGASLLNGNACRVSNHAVRGQSFFERFATAVVPCTALRATSAAAVGIFPPPSCAGFGRVLIDSEPFSLERRIPRFDSPPCSQAPPQRG